MATQVWAEKLSQEEVTVDVDFSSRCRPGESAATAVCVVSVFSGVDPNPAAMLSGIASVSNNIVSQKIIGGLPGVIYLLTYSVRTTGNNIVINEVKLAVRSSNAGVPA